MQILWITENYFPNKGGMAQSCDRIVHNLRKTGLNIDILFLYRKATQLHIKHVQNGQNIIFPIDQDLPHALNLVWLFLTQHSLQRKYTHIVAFGGHLPILASPLYASWLQLPLITLIRGNDFDTAIFTVKKREILADALQKSAAVCTVTQEKQVRISRLFPENKVVYIPNGIDLDHWQANMLDYQQANDWRQEKIAQGQKVIGIFGQLKAKKGVLFLLKVIKNANFQEYFHFLIIGDMGEEVTTYLQENPSLHYTHYHFMERFQLIPYYLASDIVAIPSFYDGMPNVLLEAGGLAKPILAAKVAGMADVVADKTHGFLFEGNDWQSCQRALFDFLQSAENILQEQGKNLQTHIREHYSEQNETTLYLNLIQSLKTLES